MKNLLAETNDEIDLVDKSSFSRLLKKLGENSNVITTYKYKK